MMALFLLWLARPLRPEQDLLPDVPFSLLTVSAVFRVFFILVVFAASVPIGFLGADTLRLLVSHGEGRYRRPMWRRYRMGKKWLDLFSLFGVLAFGYFLAYLLVYAHRSGRIPSVVLLATSGGVLFGFAMLGYEWAARQETFWSGLGHNPKRASRMSVAAVASGTFATGIMVGLLLVAIVELLWSSWPRPMRDRVPSSAEEACVRVRNAYSKAGREDTLIEFGFPFPAARKKPRPDRQSRAVVDLVERLKNDADVTSRFFLGDLDRKDDCLLAASRELMENGSWGPWRMRDVKMTLADGSGGTGDNGGANLAVIQRNAEFADLIGREMRELLGLVDLSSNGLRKAKTREELLRVALLWAIQDPERAMSAYNQEVVKRSIYEDKGRIRSESRPFAAGIGIELEAVARDTVILSTKATPSRRDPGLRAYPYPPDLVLFLSPSSMIDEIDRGVRVQENASVADARAQMEQELTTGLSGAWWQFHKFTDFGRNTESATPEVSLKLHSTIATVDLEVAPALSDGSLPSTMSPDLAGVDHVVVVRQGVRPLLLPSPGEQAPFDISPPQRWLPVLFAQNGQAMSRQFLGRIHETLGAVAPRAFFLAKTTGGWNWFEPIPQKSLPINFTFPRVVLKPGGDAEVLSEIQWGGGSVMYSDLVKACNPRSTDTGFVSVESAQVMTGLAALRALGCPLAGLDDYPSRLKNWQPRMKAKALEVRFPLTGSDGSNAACAEAAHKRRLPVLTTNWTWSVSTSSDGGSGRCSALLWVGYRPPEAALP